MTRPPEQVPLLVVLAPEVIGKAFFNADCRRVLHLWRDGLLRPVVTPGLLRLYAGVLRALTVPDTQIRRWLWWFTSAETALFLPESGPDCRGLRATLKDAATRGGAEVIVSANPAPDGTMEPNTPDWTHPATLIEQRFAQRG